MRPGMYEGPGENYEPVKTSDLAVGDVVIVERKKWDYDTGRPVPSDFIRAIVGEHATVSGPQKDLTNEPSAEWPAFAPSHGGIANLLRVLTRNMEQRHRPLMDIAKVQYAVCVQAGVYLPEEFMEDVMILDDVIGEQAQEETA